MALVPATGKLLLGRLNRTSLSSFESHYCIGQPRLLSLHGNDHLMVAFEQFDSYLLSVFALPSFALVFSHHVPSEEITALVFHSALHLTFFGTAARGSGRVAAVGEILKELHVLKHLDIPG
jgi:hypothetical protein